MKSWKKILTVPFLAATLLLLQAVPAMAAVTAVSYTHLNGEATVSATSSVFGPGYSTVHHRIKWLVMRRLIWHTQNQENLEPYIKSALAIELERDFNKSHPNY